MIVAGINDIASEKMVGRKYDIVCARKRLRKNVYGQDYLLHFGLPQFLFHVTTTYAILRHNGIEIGKRDFMGTH